MSEQQKPNSPTAPRQSFDRQSCNLNQIQKDKGHFHIFGQYSKKMKNPRQKRDELKIKRIKRELRKKRGYNKPDSEEFLIRKLRRSK
jgi:hypothetical protein